MAPNELHPSWQNTLNSEFEKSYFEHITRYLEQERSKGKTIYPPEDLIFNAFNQTPFDKIKVVILGQDPYHGPNEAMGLSFSVPKSQRIPPSLRNIFKELKNDIGMEIPDHGDLSLWASQGVLLLNAILTVEHKQAGSHKKSGWQVFTDAVISTISQKREGIVFLLWGNFAKSKADLIDKSKHHILESPHPSPLARGGFFNNHHFSKTNKILIKQAIKPINWAL